MKNLCKKVHLVYPCADIPRAPEIIGFKVKQILERRGFEVIPHAWDAPYSITPEIGDIIIGHAHPLANTVFRKSIAKPGWGRRILFQPFNYALQQNGYLDSLIDNVDLFIAICGEYWGQNLSKSPFAHFKPIFHPINLAVDVEKYVLTKQYNTENDGKRKFVYVGNDHPGKNLKYLDALAKHSETEINWIGGHNKSYQNLISHGKIPIPSDQYFKIIAKVDFHIIASKYDANPTTVLETAASGLLQVTSDTSGYLDERLRIPLSLNITEDAKLLRRISGMTSKELWVKRAALSKLLREDYSWQAFEERFLDILFSNYTPQLVFPRGITVLHVHSEYKMKLKQTIRPLFAYIKNKVRKFNDN